MPLLPMQGPGVLPQLVGRHETGLRMCGVAAGPIVGSWEDALLYIEAHHRHRPGSSGRVRQLPAARGRKSCPACRSISNV